MVRKYHPNAEAQYKKHQQVLQKKITGKNIKIGIFDTRLINALLFPNHCGPVNSDKECKLRGK
jgi:hypothetical protein